MAPNQTKANCSGMTGGKKNKFADFSVMDYEHDVNNEMTGEKRTDTSMMKNEIIRLKEKLYRLQGKKEEREEVDIMMGSLENCFFLCEELCALDDNALSSFGSISARNSTPNRVFVNRNRR